jgi:hypothetical protein
MDIEAAKVPVISITYDGVEIGNRDSGDREVPKRC